VRAREGIRRQLHVGILELGTCALEARLQRLVDELTGDRRDDDEDGGAPPTAAREREARSCRERCEKHDAAEVGEDAHRLDETVARVAKHPSHDSDVEPVDCRPAKDCGRDGGKNHERADERGHEMALETREHQLMMPSRTLETTHMQAICERTFGR